MHLNPTYLLFALLSPVAYAAPTTAGISNLSSRGQLVSTDVIEQTHDLTADPVKDTVHVNISANPNHRYQASHELHRKHLQPQLKSIFEYWIRNTKMIKLEDEGKKITPEPLEPLNIVIEDGSVPFLKDFEFWGPG
ncbi:hypothetical protein DFJ43DRAFT_554972 [Lentinula guzmanii]|uniref:Uncharacterized protein n=1 Tax=Lentinula guzmanii TaxID=2804957 RepID=A0AA38J841_9AGAR|nr:hypothetical protein DFJ43DRAFT_554972 [Lentinula guzmanii]